MAETFHYLSADWTQEAYRRLRQELTAEKMKFVSSSMVTHYKNCADGKDRSLYYRFVDGVVEQLVVVEGMPSEAEFIITGDYDVFARISKAELGSRAALMTGKLSLRGNMVKALGLSAVVDRMNKVLASIPTVY